MLQKGTPHSDTAPRGWRPSAPIAVSCTPKKNIACFTSILVIYKEKHHKIKIQKTHELNLSYIKFHAPSSRDLRNKTEVELFFGTAWSETSPFIIVDHLMAEAWLML